MMGLIKDACLHEHDIRVCINDVLRLHSSYVLYIASVIPSEAQQYIRLFYYSGKLLLCKIKLRLVCVDMNMLMDNI